MKKQHIITNDLKFEEQSYYVVEIAMGANNPIHQDIFYTGFLNGKNESPGGYNKFFHAECEIKDVYYLNVIRKINSDIKNNNKMVKDVLLKDYPEYVI